MHPLAPILAAIVATGAGPAGAPRRAQAQPGEAGPRRAGDGGAQLHRTRQDRPGAQPDEAGPERPAAPDGRSGAPENLLAGPARCVLRLLDAVRLAGPRPAQASGGRLPAPREKDYGSVKALTAPRTLEEIARRAEAGEDHPLAFWREAARAHVLESFQLVAVRRAPRGAAVVTVTESFWRPPGTELVRDTSEYLVARVEGEWRVVDRSTGRAFDDAVLAARYEGFFDDPPGSR